MAFKVARDTPLFEITLRKYEKPRSDFTRQDLTSSDNKRFKRDLVKKLCLSIGLLNPGDSRDIIVDIMLVLIEGLKERKGFTTKQIQELVIKKREEYNLPKQGIAESNIRRQLLRLRELGLVMRKNKEYGITEFLTISEVFERIREHLLTDILERIREYTREIDNIFLDQENENKVL